MQTAKRSLSVIFGGIFFLEAAYSHFENGTQTVNERGHKQVARASSINN